MYGFISKVNWESSQSKGGIILVYGESNINVSSAVRLCNTDIGNQTWMPNLTIRLIFQM